MEQTDDIDIILTLNPHGWSTCYFYISDKTFEFTITHVFNDPYTDLISALSALLNGQDDVSFFWLGEPGGQRIKISRLSSQQHKALVTIEDFGESFHEEPKSFDLKLEIEMKIKQLITLFYFQLCKTNALLQDTRFAKDRAKEFPFQAFHQFDRLVKSYMNI
ncbi:hypothetical protein [Pinibacter soli]|uniref:Uncharacterized protein n=1 Tax=Pinibacter soli TaxID=3044211 RepID=A0ABT6R9N6_9BACT|nr:hypothetical protein [Pinibacter soli]MDI3319268.1 hypothetical protein [Pinibacter soli]